MGGCERLATTNAETEAIVRQSKMKAMLACMGSPSWYDLLFGHNDSQPQPQTIINAYGHDKLRLETVHKGENMR